MYKYEINLKGKTYGKLSVLKRVGKEHYNRRITLHLTYNNETKPLSVWAKQIDIKFTTLERRVAYGWTPEETIETPVRRRT